MFGYMVVLGSGIGIAGAWISKHLIEAYPFPTNFVYTFALAAAGVMASWLLLAFTREPVDPALKDHQSHREFFAELPALVRADSNLRSFLWARLLMVVGGMGFGFVTVSAQARWHIADATAADYTAAMMIGQVIGNLLAGVLSDRHGHKLTLQGGAACSCLAFALAAAATSPAWYYVVFGLLGMAGGAFFVSGILMILELATPERRATYVGLVNTSIGVLGLLSPLAGARLAEVGYGWLFAVGAVFQLAGLIVLTVRVREPRPAKPPAFEAGGQVV
ncbi:MAG: MFS transporter [Armatimonadetes bacterium]|nr:MFS transporter [Armatimonadota bacterium]